MLNERNANIIKDDVAQNRLEIKKPVVFARLMNREWQSELLSRLDQLIAQINEKKIQELFFLDKSARPLSWLFRDRWKHKFPGTPHPVIKYVNLGHTGVTESGALDDKTIVDMLSEEINAELKTLDSDKINQAIADNGGHWKMSLFAEGEEAEGEIWLSKNHISKLLDDAIGRHPEIIEAIRKRYGQNIGHALFIDELLFNGTTLMTAVALFSKAYPQADIYGVHFFEQKFKRPTTQIPWFQQADLIGVEESDMPLETKRFTTKSGAKPDMSMELRNIIANIAQTPNID